MGNVVGVGECRFGVVGHCDHATCKGGGICLKTKCWGLVSANNGGICSYLGMGDVVGMGEGRFKVVRCCNHAVREEGGGARVKRPKKKPSHYGLVWGLDVAYIWPVGFLRGHRSPPTVT
jgi:hypothetical protein